MTRTKCGRPIRTTWATTTSVLGTMSAGRRPMSGGALAGSPAVLSSTTSTTSGSELYHMYTALAGDDGAASLKEGGFSEKVC